MPCVSSEKGFSSVGSSGTGGTVFALAVFSVTRDRWMDEDPIELAAGRGAAWRVRIDDAMLPLAAKKPSGRSDCSKLRDTRRRRPLRDEDAAGRFGAAVETREREAYVGDRGLDGAFSCDSIAGNGSVSGSFPGDGIAIKYVGRSSLRRIRLRCPKCDGMTSVGQ